MIRFWESRLLKNVQDQKFDLDVWCEYIDKLQEKDEQSSEELCSALRRCTILFSQDERYGLLLDADLFLSFLSHRYAQDERLVHIWMLYISHCNDKLVTALCAEFVPLNHSLLRSL